MEVTLKVRVKQGNIAEAGGPAVVVNLFQGVKKPGGATKAVDEAIGGLISRALETGDFQGKREETLVLYPAPGRRIPERVVVVGLGKKEDFDTEAARRIGGVVVKALRGLGVKKASTVLHGGDSGKPTASVARAFAEGVIMGAYAYTNYLRDGRGKPLSLEELTVVERLASKIKGIREGVQQGTRLGHAVNEARELGNGPSNEVTPTFLANTAKRLGRAHGLKIKVMDRDQCLAAGMGAFMGVAQGSEEPPKFIVMEHKHSRAKGTVCFVGKGITFDTGGISIKPAADMDQMKFDMGGAAAVIGAMRYAAEQNVPVNVVGIVAATENMPGGRAYKPGDILTNMDGVTIEVLNTDAEGRLALCDALSYAKRFEPDAVIDLATLTGACVIALGEHACGLMANDEWLLDAVYDASRISGDRAWPLPLWTEYRDMVKSPVADIKNTAGRGGGSITAGAFLGTFTNEYRWAHLDIAGSAWGNRKEPYLNNGATGSGVRILAEFLNRWKQPKGSGPTPGDRTSLLPESENSAPAAKAAESKKAVAVKKPAAKKATRKKTAGARRKTGRKTSKRG